MATWLGNLFGDGELGEPLNYAWRLQWDAPSLVGLILLAAACAVMIGSSRRDDRRQRAAAWMGAVAAVLLLLMQLRPQLELQYGDPPRIAVLLDDSSSMQQVDCQGESRFAAAIQMLSGERGKHVDWRRRLQLHVFSVANDKSAAIDRGDDAIAVASWTPSGTASPLEAAVNSALSAASVRPWEAVILVSDGAATGGESVAEAARRCAASGTPFFAVGCGPLKGSPNIAVASISGDRVAYLGDVATVEAQVSAAGEFESDTVHIELLSQDDEQLAETRLQLAAGETKTATLRFRPQAVGRLQVQVRASEISGETQTDDNVGRWEIRVIEGSVRVALVFGRPSFEFRFLKDLLTRSEATEAAVYLQSADPRLNEIDPDFHSAWPEPDLAAFDVFVLGDADPALAPRDWSKSLRRFVAAGGGLCWIPGEQHAAEWLADREFQELAPAARLQLDATVQRLAATKAGQSVSFVNELVSGWDEMPRFHHLFRADSLDETAVALLVGEDQSPGLLLQRYGAGLVATQGGDETWRWIRPSQDDPFAVYWLGLLRRLAQGAVSRDAFDRLAADRTHYSIGDVASIRATGLQPQTDELTLEATHPDGSRTWHPLDPIALTPGAFELSMKLDAAGEWGFASYSDTGEAARVSVFVAAAPTEADRQAARLDDLASAAEEAGGEYVHVSAFSRVLPRLPAASASDARVVVHDVWVAHAVLVAVFCCLVGTWALRRAWGLR